MRRPRRPALRAAALLLPAALLLAACSGGSSAPAASSSASTSAPSSAAASSAPSSAASAPASAAPVVTDLAGVQVADAETGAPTVTTAPFSVTSVLTRELTRGTGAAVADGALVSIDFVATDAATGARSGATDYDGRPTSFLLGEGVIPAFRTALAGVTTGSRVLVAVPPGQVNTSASSAPGAADSVLYLVDVRATGPGWATGQTVTPPAGLPAVAVDPTTHVPTVTIPAGVPAPTSLVAQPLIKGAGPAVAAGQALTVMYTGVLYRDGTTFDSSWPRGSALTFPVGQQQVIAGWDTGLVGQTVGSQVLLVVPPAEGYGAAGQEQAGIRGDDTLVFVVDVLAAA